jgi:type IV secretion system protein VirB10
MAAPYPVLCAMIAASMFCDEPVKKEALVTPPVPITEELDTIPEPMPEPKPVPKPLKPGLLVVQPRSIDFGTVMEGKSTPNRTVTLRNIGEQPVVLWRINHPSKQVDLTDNCPAQLGPNSSCTISLSLDSNRPGVLQNNLKISMASGQTHQIGLSAKVTPKPAPAPKEVVKTKVVVKTVYKEPEAPPRPSREEMLREIAKAARYRQDGAQNLLHRASLGSSSRRQVKRPAGYWKMQDKDYTGIGIAKTNVSLPVDRCRTITEDAYIDASLENSVNSMIGGRVIAVVSYPVFASDCDRILIPSGTTVIGEFEPLDDNSITRLKINWRRMLLPDGSSIVFDFESADVEGKTALQGEIDTRDEEKFMRIFAFSAINLGMHVAASYFQNKASSTGEALAQINTDTSSQIGEVTAAIAQQQLNIKNVLRLRKRMEIKIIPTKDLWFPEVEYVEGIE